MNRDSPDQELGPFSTGLLRASAVAVVVIVIFFIVDAIIG
jgi:hypothetical protein